MNKKITNYTDLKTFEDACLVEKLNPKKVLPDFKLYPAKDRKAMIAHAKLVIIARAANRLANGGKVWKANFGNHDQWKYAPWLYMESGSSGFRFGDYDYWYSRTLVGSRLCFISSEVAKYVGETFIKLYNDYMA
jgi:hypothetical protein